MQLGKSFYSIKTISCVFENLSHPFPLKKKVLRNWDVIEGILWIQKEEEMSVGVVDCDFWTHEYQELHKSAKNALLISLKNMDQLIIHTYDAH